MSTRIESGFNKGRTGHVVQDASKLVLLGFIIFAVSTVCVTLPLIKGAHSKVFVALLGRSCSLCKSKKSDPNADIPLGKRGGACDQS